MKIGNVILDNNVFLAPMAGVTDIPFRILCKEQGCGLVYTEMVSAKALTMMRRVKAHYDGQQRGPVALQIFGSDPVLWQGGRKFKRIKDMHTGHKYGLSHTQNNEKRKAAP